MALKPDTPYRIVNARTGTVLDMAGPDKGWSVSGWERNNGPNQVWKLIPGGGSHFMVVSEAEGYPVALSLLTHADQGMPLFGKPMGTSMWEVIPDPNNTTLYKFNYPNAPLSVDLRDGNSANGASVTLWERWDGTVQSWRFEEV